MKENEIIMRIDQLCKARSWTYYKLAKESGITYSTLFTMIRKANVPSIPTLMKICKGFGITIGEFFDENAETVMLTEKQKNHLLQWENLSDENKTIVEKYMRFLLSQQM